MGRLVSTMPSPRRRLKRKGSSRGSPAVPILRGGSQRAETCSPGGGGDRRHRLGARVPIVLTSRADKTLARLGSCAIALLLARRPVGSQAVTDAILVLNSGSSSISSRVFPGHAPDRPGGPCLRGCWTSDTACISSAKDPRGDVACGRSTPAKGPAMGMRSPGFCVGWTTTIRDYRFGRGGHRVVHGGPLYSAPVRIDGGWPLRGRFPGAAAPTASPPPLRRVRSFIPHSAGRAASTLLFTTPNPTSPRPSRCRAGSPLKASGVMGSRACYEYIASVLADYRSGGRTWCGRRPPEAAAPACVRCVGARAWQQQSALRARRSVPMSHRCGNLISVIF